VTACLGASEVVTGAPQGTGVFVGAMNSAACVLTTTGDTNCEVMRCIDKKMAKTSSTIASWYKKLDRGDGSHEPWSMITTVV
jgi:hypothetical protein